MEVKQLKEDIITSLNATLTHANKNDWREVGSILKTVLSSKEELLDKRTEYLKWDFDKKFGAIDT